MPRWLVSKHHRVEATPKQERDLSLDASGSTAVIGVLPPGAFPWSVRRKLSAMPYFLRVLAADPRHFPKFIWYGANVGRAHPADRHWYLVVAGVRPQAQRQGLGSRLMRHELDAADSDGTPVYLETADRADIAYYQRFGFIVIDDALELVPGGPSHVAMRRPAGG